MHNRSNRVRRPFAAIVLAVLALAVVGAPAAAVAQNVSPTDEQYENGVLGGSAGGNVGGNNVVVDPNADQVGDLPFTGLDVAAIAAIGVGLLGAGLAVRKVARTHGDHAV